MSIAKKLVFWQSSAFPGGFLFTAVFSLWLWPVWPTGEHHLGRREPAPSSLCLPTHSRLQGLPPQKGLYPHSLVLFCFNGCPEVQQFCVRWLLSFLEVFFCLLLFSLLVNCYFFHLFLLLFFLPIGENGLVETKGRE